MAWLDPPEKQEAPLIQNVCPQCNAIDITLDKTNLVEDIIIPSWEDDYSVMNEYLYSVYKCPYCNSEISDHDFQSIYSDDFADMITDCLTGNWIVSGTGNGATWHEVEIAYDLGVELVLPTIITIKVNETGHIDWSQVKEDCIEVNNKFFNAEEIELLKKLGI